jgi:hypothetical protein
MRQPSPAVRIRRRLAGFRDSDKALRHCQNRQTGTPYTGAHGNPAQGRNSHHKQLLYHNRGKAELGTVLNLCCQFPFSSLEIRHFEPHSSLCLGVFVLKNQFVFSPGNP